MFPGGRFDRSMQLARRCEPTLAMELGQAIWAHCRRGWGGLRGTALPLRKSRGAGMTHGAFNDCYCDVAQWDARVVMRGTCAEIGEKRSLTSDR